MATMDVASLRSQIQEKFGESLEEGLVTECVRICQMFNLSGEILCYKWEAMCFGMSGPRPLFTADYIPALKAKCQSDLAKANAARQKLKANLNGPLSRTFGGGPGRASVRSAASPAIRTPVKLTVRRQDGFGVVAGEERKMPVAGPSKVVFVGPKIDEESRKRRAYRYMYETAADRSRVLDNRIDEFGEWVKEHYNIEELGDPSANTEEEVVVVGRVTHDSETSSGSVKLNEASVTLESSRQMGSGGRVPLRFDPSVKVRQGVKGVGGIGLFPGAIVALRGKNGGGGWFLVTEVLSLPPMESSPNNGMKMEDSEPFSMHVACGPFTPDADLKFKPWHRLVSKIKADRPAVVLLVGPFIDVTHPAVKSGEVDTDLADMFRETFISNMQDFLSSSPDSIVLIVPSVRDVISDHAVFPQCELGPEYAADPRIHLLPNPCRFSLNGISFAVSSVDVIFHLRKEEFFKRAGEVDSISSVAEGADVQANDAELVAGGAGVQANDAMTTTCRHLLQQRNFYPIFPAPLDLAHEVNLDITHLKDIELGGGENDDVGYAPDVLVVSSRLKHFSKVVDSTVAINPSFLTKGTFAVLTCWSSPGPVHNRVKAEVQKLD